MLFICENWDHDWTDKSWDFLILFDLVSPFISPWYACIKPRIFYNCSFYKLAEDLQPILQNRSNLDALSRIQDDYNALMRSLNELQVFNISRLTPGWYCYIWELASFSLPQHSDGLIYIIEIYIEVDFRCALHCQIYSDINMTFYILRYWYPYLSYFPLLVHQRKITPSLAIFCFSVYSCVTLLILKVAWKLAKV